MRKKLLIIMANADPANADELSAPLFQATVAAAMSHEVEVVLTGRAGMLAAERIAHNLEVNHDTHRTLHDVIVEAKKAGVIFKLCTPSLDTWGETLIQEIDEAVSSAYLVAESMDDDTVTFTY